MKSTIKEVKAKNRPRAIEKGVPRGKNERDLTEPEAKNGPGRAGREGGKGKESRIERERKYTTEKHPESRDEGVPFV